MPRGKGEVAAARKTSLAPLNAAICCAMGDLCTLGSTLGKDSFLYFKTCPHDSSGLSPQCDQNTCSDCEDAHEQTESRKTETQQRYQSRYDEPGSQQDHAEILSKLNRLCHWKTPFCERVESIYQEARVTRCLINRLLSQSWLRTRLKHYTSPRQGI